MSTEPTEKDFTQFENKIGIEFQDKNLLIQAFTHRSYINENREVVLHHNERLEFLGDAVLELVVTKHLFHTYPERPEGELTSLRAALVNTKMLSEVGHDLQMSDVLLLSKGEERETNGKAREYILANTVEALIGAIYLDQGLNEAEKFITTYIWSKLEYVVETRQFQDAKSTFQERAQEHTSITPTYTVMKEWGPDHAKQFRVGVYLGDDLIAEGEGSSKQEAEQDAAAHALEARNWENE